MNLKFMMLAMLVGLSACKSYDNELLFTESTELGLTVSPNPAGGSQFVFGYRQTDLAVVPVGVIDGKGKVLQRRSGDGNSKDAVSVFAQFNANLLPSSSEAATVKPKLALGRFFATGVAATKLAKGYKRAMMNSGEGETGEGTGDVDSPGSAGWTGRETANPFVRVAAVGSPSTADNAGKGAGPDAVPRDAKRAVVETREAKALRPLIFGQRDSFGLTIGSSLEAEKPFSATVGYSGRNVAVMPVFAERPDGGFEGLGGEAEDSKLDTFSVIGQFRADADTDTAEVALERFFATGLAAQHLADGFAARVEREIVAAELRRRAAETAASKKIQ